MQDNRYLHGVILALGKALEEHARDDEQWSIQRAAKAYADELDSELHADILTAIRTHVDNHAIDGAELNTAYPVLEALKRVITQMGININEYIGEYIDGR